MMAVQTTDSQKFFEVIYSDLSGKIRGKRYPGDQASEIMSKGISLPASVMLLDVAGENHDPCGRGFSDGDPDAVARPIDRTHRPVPWAAHKTSQVLVTLFEYSGAPYRFEPRNVLARTCESMNADGIFPVVAFELEFFLTSRERGPNGEPVLQRVAPSNRRPLNQLMDMDEIDVLSEFLSDLNDACGAQGIPISAMSSEYAAGQFEVNLQHVADPLRAADHCVLFKRAVRGVAQQHGFDATFMAKPFLNQPGSGMHVHVSLLGGDEELLFDDPRESESTLRYAVNGLLSTWPCSMAIFAPNRNSYRRFQPNLFVPISQSWGLDNRSVAVRVPRALGTGWRLEHRVSGADANPYLVLSAILAGIAEGVICRQEPPAQALGNAGEAYGEDIPFDLLRALDRMMEAGPIRDRLGAEYLEVYRACKLAEFDKLESRISMEEYDFYL